MRLTRTLRPAAFAAALVLVLGGCSLLDPAEPEESENGTATQGQDQGSAEPSASSEELPALAPSAAQELDVDPAEDAAYADFYDQEADWGTCPEDISDQSDADLDCAEVTVPLAWNDPAQGEVTISMVRLKASGDSQGSLFVNPGGPGGSGVDMVAGSGEAMFSDDLRAGYDIIGFDPRGISRSDGIECLDDAQTDEYLSDTYDGTSEEGLDKSVEWMKRIAAACEKNSGEILPFMDTYSAARDLDVLRTSVGSEKLDYLGFSYGTYLGSTFADVYPERVGKFVLDGVMDPSLNGEQITEGQAAGFDHAYEQFAAYCLEQGEDCPLKGPDAADGKQQLSDLLDSIADQPLDSGDPDRPLTGALASSAVMTLMYQDELWDFGISALGQAANGDGSQLLLLADLSNGREDDGSYTGNGSYSIMAVNCLDHPAPASLEYQKQKTAELLEKFPEVGFTAYDQTLCDQWPVQPMREPAPISASGAPTIVLIGTTGDPATPYTWAESLNKQLDDSVLLTFEGNGHTAYGRSGGCIEEAVDGYFLEDTIPEDGLTCSV